jgi:hypothetical protein
VPGLFELGWLAVHSADESESPCSTDHTLELGVYSPFAKRRRREGGRGYTNVNEGGKRCKVYRMVRGKVGACRTRGGVHNGVGGGGIMFTEWGEGAGVQNEGRERANGERQRNAWIISKFQCDLFVLSSPFFHPFLRPFTP